MKEVTHLFVLDKYEYEIVTDYREAFDMEAVVARYSEILAKYDYILGDWGYNQLRLKGFYEDKHPKSAFDTKISTVQDYLYEYCNFGCAYFILKRGKKIAPEKKQPKEVAEVEKNVLA